MDLNSLLKIYEANSLIISDVVAKIDYYRECDLEKLKTENDKFNMLTTHRGVIMDSIKEEYNKEYNELIKNKKSK